MISSVKEHVSKIELHYYFSDESHSMTASIRNKCESYVLGMLKEISSVINARLITETEAFAEGGLREKYVLRGRSEYLRAFAAAVFHYVLPLEVDIEKVVSEENKQDIKLRIDKLRKELKERERDEDAKVDLQNVAVIFRNNLKIIKLKSNFFRQITACEKVTKLSVQLVDVLGAESGKPAIVNRKRFDSYMLVTDTLKPEQNDTAVIEIISPVLKTGNYKWKGIYAQTGRIINFAMKDNDFKNDVINQSIPFKNGTRIECVLESTRKMNEFGEVVVTGYSVLTVNKKLDDNVVIETPQGKTVKKKKEGEMQQLDLFGSLFG
jgi:division protein CdvB (Snf7/Vps24/ESCRT-III family)